MAAAAAAETACSDERSDVKWRLICASNATSSAAAQHASTL